VFHYKWHKTKWNIHHSSKPSIYTKQNKNKISVNMGLELNVSTMSLLLMLLTSTTINAQTKVFDVRNYGAKPNIDITTVIKPYSLC
jgi:hypothetical protein